MQNPLCWNVTHLNSPSQDTQSTLMVSPSSKSCQFANPHNSIVTTSLKKGFFPLLPVVSA